MKTGRPRSFDIRKEDLERMRNAGLGRVLIAKIYGCDQSTIRHWLIKYDLETVMPPRPPKQLRMERLLAQQSIKQDMHVYVICHLKGDVPSGPTKVGIGNDPKARLATLQVGNPHRLALWATYLVPADMAATLIERAIHEQLDDRAMSGEWFDVSPQEAAIAARECLARLWGKYLGYDQDRINNALKTAEVRYLAAE